MTKHATPFDVEVIAQDGSTNHLLPAFLPLYIGIGRNGITPALPSTAA
jgi:hypothetical protein